MITASEPTPFESFDFVLRELEDLKGGGSSSDDSGKKLLQSDYKIQTILISLTLTTDHLKVVPNNLVAFENFCNRLKKMETLWGHEKRFKLINEKIQRMCADTKKSLEEPLPLFHEKKLGSCLDLTDLPERTGSPFSIYGVFLPLLNIPQKIGELYSDYFVDQNGPWKKVFDLDLETLKNVLKINQFSVINLQRQLESHSNPSHLDHLILNLIKILFCENESLNSSGRECSDIFIDQLRLILTSSSFEEQLEKINVGQLVQDNIRFVTDLCYYRYNEVKIYPFCEKLILLMIEAGRIQLKEEGFEDLTKMPLQLQFKCIQAAPQSLKGPILSLFLKRLCGATSIYYDPQKTNIPWVLYDFRFQGHTGIEKQIRVLRLGTPTFQRINYSTMTFEPVAHISPEFDCFVWNVMQKKQRILFTSLQDDSKRWIGTEDTRNDALKKLVKKYPNHFVFVIMAQDSSFYYQNGDYENLSDVKVFKKNFLHQLLGEKTGYYFPPEWMNESFKEQLATYIDELHSDLFEGREVLSLQERGILIETLHIRLVLHLMDKANVDKMIFCCKDSIDRAGKCNALLLYFILIALDKEKSPEYLKMMMVYIHAATVIVKQKEMNERRNRLLTTLECLQNSDVRKRLKARKNSYGIIGTNLEIGI